MIAQPRPTRIQRLLPAAVVATFLFAAAPVAQSPLTTTYASNNGGAVGGQVFFDLAVSSPTGITIKSLDLNLGDVVGTAGTINILTVAGGYTAGTNTTTLGNWTGPSSSGPIVARGVDQRSHVCFPGGVFLPFGVHGIAVQYVGVKARYTNGIGAPPVLHTSRTEVQFLFGAAQNVPWTGLFSPRIWNGDVHYDVGASLPCPTCANKVEYGAPCASPCAPFPMLHVDADFPVLGEALEIVTTGASPCATAGMTLIGLSPTFPTAILQPPWTCFQHVNPTVAMLGLPFGGSWSTVVPLPNSAAFCGLNIYVQSVTFETPWAVVSSNGLQLTIGS
ncbi:MAG: hypothetical protein KDC98_13880 [Planctomycetes bacterium]|nr:hypothetical protein [Planctomycetota bacterium]